MADEGNGRTDAEVERLRQAVNDALQQLDWAIGFLHGIGKTREARVLSQNRRYIRRQLMREAEQPLPTDVGQG
jgi:hypothetical protein